MSRNAVICIDNNKMQSHPLKTKELTFMELSATSGDPKFGLKI